MKNKVVYPGTFDPITLGHVDIIKRASLMYDEVTVAVSSSLHKKLMFDTETRLDMVKNAVKGMKNVKVDSYSGLLVNYMKKNRKRIVVRGLRALSDFEYEFQMALMNRTLNKKIETVFLMPGQEYTFLSSSMVKEIAILDGDFKKLVPLAVYKKLKNKQRI